MGKIERQFLEAALRERIDAIFDRCTALCGFSVAERLVSENKAEGIREWELYVSALAAYPQLDKKEAQVFIGEISSELAELCNECPQAADLLPGRTFARSWH